MTGLAGIGMGLLRIAADDRVPCVPMLDPVCTAT
jgi:lantibiotic modifying enzyme